MTDNQQSPTRSDDLIHGEQGLGVTRLRDDLPDTALQKTHRLDDADDNISLLELVNVLLRRWRFALGFPFGAALLAVAFSLLLPPSYTASTSFVPEASSSSRLPTALAGLAGQFGLAIGADARQSPRFYANVLQSREIMNRVLRDRYPDPRTGHNPTDSTTLLELLAVDGADQADSLDEGREVLERHLSVRVDNQTSIVTLEVSSRHPSLAAEMANRFVHYLNEFNATTRQSQARERRIFAEQQAVEAENQLRTAEEQAKAFHERNRLWLQSPQLVFEEGQLRRQIDIRQELFLTLKRELETARIDEVNDVPVITVIDTAIPPEKKSGPKRAILVTVSFIIGSIVAIFGAFTADYLARARRLHGAEYIEFRGLVAGVAHSIRGVLRGRRNPS